MQNIGDITEEVAAFKAAKLWQGGFSDGDPLQPLSWTSYTTTGFVSVYYALAKAAIEPYMAKGSIVMEIGPGHGAWTKALLHWGAAKVIALDVQSREFNNIDYYLRESAGKLDYHEVSDCACSMVKDSSVDFVWSGGAFVHLSEIVQREYFAAFARKMRPGAHGFVQYADFDMYNSIVYHTKYHIHHIIADVIRGEEGEKVRKLLNGFDCIRAVNQRDEAERDSKAILPGRYFFVGMDTMKKIIADVGLELLDINFLPSFRDPVVHFRRKRGRFGRMFAR